MKPEDVGLTNYKVGDFVTEALGITYYEAETAEDEATVEEAIEALNADKAENDKAKAEIEETDNGREVIVVTEVPYMVNKADMLTRISEMIHEKKIEGVADIRELTNRDGIRIEFLVKKDANANVVLNTLFKYSALQSSFSINNVALVGGRPRTLTLKDMISTFVDFRHEVVVRRTRYELEKAQKRAHILEALLRAIDVIDEIIAIIKASKSVDEAKSTLMQRFEFDEIQASAIVEMRLRQLTGLEKEKLQNEYEELAKFIAKCLEILASDELQLGIVKSECQDLKAKYGDERRCKIDYSASSDFNPEDFYADDEMVITISHMGYIKRTPLTEYRSQNRGGVGSRGSDTRDSDFIEYIYTATMHNTMLFFTQRGKCYWLKVYEIPEGNKNSKGRAIQNMLNIDADDAVNAFVRVKTLADKNFIESHNIVFCTKNGIIKKTSLEAYSRPRTNGVNAILIREDDRVIEVRMTNGSNEIIMANRNGRAIRFNETAVRPMGRVSTGVRGMQLDDDGQDEVIGMICVKDPEKETIMVVSEQGYGKRSDIEDYRKTNRGAKGVKTLNITEKTGKLVAIKTVTDENDLMIINKSGITIRLKVADVRVMGRATQGVRLIDLKKRGDQIGSVCKVATETEEESGEPTETIPNEENPTPEAN